MHLALTSAPYANAQEAKHQINNVHLNKIGGDISEWSESRDDFRAPQGECSISWRHSILNSFESPVNGSDVVHDHVSKLVS